jgi:hypothetical protein
MPNLSEAPAEQFLIWPAQAPQQLRQLYRVSGYRDARRGSYRIGVFGAPRLMNLDDGSRIYHLGFDDGASIYIKEEGELTSSPIYKWESGSEDKAADDLAEWIKQSSLTARK